MRRLVASFRLGTAALLGLAALLVFGMVAFAQQSPEAQRRAPDVRRAVIPTPPPLPLDLARQIIGVSTPAPRAKAVPPFPTYAQYLASKARRHIKSASGGTVCVGLASGGTTCSPGATDTQIIPLNTATTWQSTTLPDTTANHYKDYFMAPNQTTPQFVAGPYTGPTGASHAITLSMQGVYVFGALNTSTNNWDALTYIVVGSGAHVETFADSNLTTAQQSFSAGSNVYINGFSLTPTDRYAFVVDSTAITGSCVFTFPASSPAAPYAGPCDASSGKITGANAAGGNFFATWVTSSSLATGTYSITLYDQTTNTRIAQRQIAITNGSTGIAVVGNYTTGGLVGPVQKFAYDGGLAPYQDTTANPVALAAVAGPGLSNGRSYAYVVTDPNGTVVANVAVPANSIVFGYTGSLTIYTLSSANAPYHFAPNVYTITFVDRTAGNNPPTVLASSTFQVLGYSAAVTWDDGTIAANTVTPPVPAAVTKGIIYTNDAESHFGVGNADPIVKFVTTSNLSGGNTKYPTVNWATGVTTTSCGTNCFQTTATDSAGQQWTVQLSCTGAGCGSSNNAARAYTITSTPVNANYGLAANQTLTLPQLTIADANGNQCGSGCGFMTQIQPMNAPTVDTAGNGSVIANEIDVLDNSSVTYALNASVNVWGTRVTTTTQAGRLVQGDTQATAYQPRYASMFYDNGQPRTTSVSGIKQVLQIPLTDNSVGAQTVSQLAITFPSQFNISSMSVDAMTTGGWAAMACPTGLNPYTYCVKTTTPLTNSGGANTTATLYLDMDPPSSSFAPTAIAITVLDTPSFAAQASGSNVAVAAGTPASLTPLQLASYSLNYSLMTGAMSPATIGQGSSTPRSQTVGFTFTNTPTTSDIFPDYVDAILFQVDAQTTTTLTWPTTWTTSPSNWTLLDSWTSGSQTNYLFGLCSAQDSRANIPTTTTFGQGLSTCTGTPNEATGSLAPSGVFSASGTGSVKAGTGSITGRIFAHGTNGNGWSQPVPLTLNVTNADSASAGFTMVNGTPVSNGSQPTVGGDPSTTNGSSFQYVVNNTGNTNITKITVGIPGPDISGASDQEPTGPYFYVTSTGAAIKSALAYTGSGGSLTSCTGVAVNEPTNAGSPITTTPGSIVLSGCSIPPGYSVTISFNAKSPATVNSTYQFSTTFDGTSMGVAANEQWFADTQLKITLSATLSIILAPSGTGPSGTASAASSCAASSGPSTANLTTALDFGTVPVGVTETCTDGIMVSVATNAGGTVGWNLYATMDANPANVVGFEVDSAHSSTGNSVTFSNNTAWNVAGTATPGQTLATRPSGVAATRTPFDVVTSWRVAPADTSAHTQTITFTFIAQ